MKKSLILMILLLLSVTLSAQHKRGKRSKSVYFYAVGWEYLPMPDQSKINKQPVVSNIFGMQCKEDHEPNKTGITNELNDYYTAYLGKRRGFNGLNRTIALGPFDSWSEAEKHRRKSIADYNLNWEPLLLKDFSADCD